MSRIIFTLFLFIFAARVSVAQINPKSQKDFNNLQVFSEKGDYKAGLFYSKKSEKFIAKKTSVSSTETLLLLCYKAHFLNQLDNKQEYLAYLPEIDRRISAAIKESNPSALLAVYKQYSTLYFTDGIYSKGDSLYTAIKANSSKLLPLEREQLEYYKLYADYKKGYLNEVSALCTTHIDYLTTHAIYDSVYKKDKILQKKLNKDEIKERYYWAGRYLGLQLRALMDNGLSDTAFAKIEKYEKDFSNILASKKGLMAEIYYIKGLCYLKQDEFKKAEKEFHSASATAKD